MNLFILDKNKKIIDVIESREKNEPLPERSYFFDDLYKQDLTTGAETFQLTVEDKKNTLNVGNYILFRFKNKYKLFNILTEKLIHEDSKTKTCYCEIAGLSLLNHFVRPMSLENVNIKGFLENILYGTDFKVGNVEPKINNVEYISIDTATTVYTAIQDNLSVFGCEIEFRFEEKNNKIIGQYIDVYKQRGRVTNKRIEYGRNIDSIQKETDLTDFCTALYAYTSNNIDFKDIEWKVENGNPVDKPLGQDFIVDLEAHEKYDKQGNYTVGIYESNVTNSSDLILDTYKELQRRKEPKITYNVDLSFLDYDIELGDTVYVIDTEDNLEIELSARVNTLEISFTDDTKGNATFSNYKKEISKINPNLTEEDIFDYGASSDVISANEIECERVAQAIDGTYNIYINSSEYDEKNEFKEGAVFKTLQEAINRTPSYLNGYGVHYHIENDIYENIRITNFTGGYIELFMYGHNINGYMYISDCDRVYLRSNDGINKLDKFPYIKTINKNTININSRRYTILVNNVKYCNIDDFNIYGITSDDDRNLYYGLGAEYNSYIRINNSKFITCDNGIRANNGSNIQAVDCSGKVFNNGSVASNKSSIGISGKTGISGNKNNYLKYDISTVDVASSVVFDTVSEVAESDANVGTSGIVQLGNTVVKVRQTGTYRVTKYKNWKKDSTARCGNIGYGKCCGVWFFKGALTKACKDMNISSIQITINRQQGGYPNKKAAVQLRLHSLEKKITGSPVSYLSDFYYEVELNFGKNYIKIEDIRFINALKSGAFCGFAIYNENSNMDNYAVCSNMCDVSIDYLTEYTPSITYKWLITVISNTNVRSSLDMTSTTNILGKALAGETFYIIERNLTAKGSKSEWVKINFNGQEAYMSIYYSNISKIYDSETDDNEEITTKRTLITDRAKEIVQLCKDGKAWYSQYCRTTDFNNKVTITVSSETVLGTTYKQPGKGKWGFDCSSFVGCCYQNAGYDFMKGLSCSAGTLQSVAKKHNAVAWRYKDDPTLSRAKPGDIIIVGYSTPPSSISKILDTNSWYIHHTLIYMGDGYVAEAIGYNSGIQYRKRAFTNYDAFVRIEELTTEDNNIGINTRQYIVFNASTNIRSSLAITSDNIVGKAKNGDKYEVIKRNLTATGSTTEWVSFYYNNKIAYASMKYATILTTTETNGKEEIPVTPPETEDDGCKLLGQKYDAMYTAYYPANNSMEGGLYDALGYKLKGYPDELTCAAPAEVPFGTKIMVLDTGTEYDNKIFTVTDRGGGIKKVNGVYHIDLCFKTYSECDKLGAIRNAKCIIGDIVTSLNKIAVITKACYVKDKATSGATNLGKVTINSRWTVIEEEKDGYIKIEFRGMTGYVLADNCNIRTINSSDTTIAIGGADNEDEDVIKDPNKNDTTTYSFSKASELISVVESYYNVRESVFTYGQKKTCLSADKWSEMVDAKGWLKIDCSTLIGSGLRGIKFEDSKYSSQENFIIKSNDPRTDIYTWAFNPGRTAADIGKYMYERGWEIDKEIVKYQPADIICYDKTVDEDNGRWRGITHVAMVYSIDEEENVYIIESTNGKSNNYRESDDSVYGIRIIKLDFTEVDTIVGVFRINDNGEYIENTPDTPPSIEEGEDDTKLPEEDSKDNEEFQMIEGIDCSYYQENIDWNNFSKSKYKFAILRIGYGANTFTLDSKFDEYYSSCIKEGIPIGAYFYSHALTEEQAKAEANAVIDKLNSIGAKEVLSYPVWCDIERSDQEALGKAQLTKVAIAFMDTLLKAGYYSGLYTNLNFYNNCYDIDSLLNYDIWVARYNSNIEKPGIDRYSIWQYGISSDVPGVSTDCDVNRCYIDYPKKIKAWKNKDEEEYKKEEFNIIYTGILNANCNVRDGAGTSNNKIGYLEKGSHVEIIEIEPTLGWYKIVYPDAPCGYAYITYKYTTLDENIYSDIVVSSRTLTIKEGEFGILEVSLASKPRITQKVVIDIADRSLITLSTTSITFKPNEYNIKRNIIITALLDNNTVDDLTKITLKTGNTAQDIDIELVIKDLGEEDNSIPVIGLELDYTSINIDKDTSKRLIPTITPENATNKSVSWKSENENIATVTENGLVIGKGQGTTNIKCIAADETNGTIEANCSVTVNDTDVVIATATIISSSLNVRDGGSTSNNAIGFLSNGDNVQIVEVTSTGWYKIKYNNGYGYITGSSNYVNITSGSIKPISVSLSSSNINLMVGESKIVTVSYTPSSANTNIDFTWTSNNSNSTVSNGKITGISPGSSVITVSNGNKSVICNINITAADTSITYTSKSGYSYRTTGNYANTWSSKEIIRQGQYTESDGLNRGLWFFGNSFENLRGKTIKSLKLRIKREQAGSYGSSIDIYVRTHNYSEKGTGYTVSSAYQKATVNAYSNKYETITINDEEVINNITNGSALGFALYTSNKSSSYYCAFNSICYVDVIY